MKLSRLYIASLCVFSLSVVLFLISCKTSTRGEAQSGVSQLTIKSPKELDGVVTSVKVAATPNEASETCKVIYYPAGTNGTSFQSIDKVEDKIELKFLNVCFPYEVEIKYMCPPFGKDKKAEDRVECYTGKATAKLENLSDNTLTLRIPLTGQNGYEKKPVENRNVVSDFFKEECAKGIVGVLRNDSSSAWLLSKECDLTIKGVNDFASSSISQDIQDRPTGEYDYNKFIVADQGYKTVITSIKIDAEDPNKAESEKLEGSKISEILAKTVKKSIEIKYCDLEENYDVRAAGCSKVGTITWTYSPWTGKN